MPAKRKSEATEIEHKTVRFEVKAEDEPGRFTGVASVMGVEDLGGDIIEPGAFNKTLQENPEVVTLWQHSSDEVIGSATFEVQGNNLVMEGKLDMDDPTAVKAYNKMKKRLVKGLSIGFQTIKVMWEELEDRYIRHINELKLWEVSVVTFPMNPGAQITAVKQNLSEDVEGLLAFADQERKAGRKLSAATRDKIASALATLQALLVEEEDTSEEDGAKSAAPPEAVADEGATKQDGTEPEYLHSALELIEAIRAA